MRAVYLHLDWLLAWIMTALCINIQSMPELTHIAECNPPESASADTVHSEISQLRLENGELIKQNSQLNLALAALRQTNEKMLHELLILKRRMFGRNAEASDELGIQGQLFSDPIVEIELPAGGGRPPLKKTPSTPPKRHPRVGRMVLPADLPRVIEQILWPEGVLDGNGALLPGFVRIGEDRTERLAYQAGSHWVAVIERPRVALRGETLLAAEIAGTPAVVSAPLPSLIVNGGLLHETLIAHTIISKIDDHLPLHRQSEMMLRDCGVRLPISTLSDQVLTVGIDLKPLWVLLLAILLSEGAVHCDETGVPTQAKGKLKKTRIWTFSSTAGARIHGTRIILYLYSDDKSGIHVRRHFTGWKGYFHCDASSVYDELFKQNPLILEVTCWSHGRRKFFDIAKASTAFGTAHEAVERINALFDIERHCAEQEMTTDQRHAYRQQHAVPLIAEFRAWAIEQTPQLSPTSPSAKAFAYFNNHWPAFERYTERGDLKIDNNTSERDLRVAALGRKNWLFAGSARGGEAFAILLSLIETAKANGLNPRDWLLDTLKRLPTLPNNRLHELLPLHKTV